MKPLGIYIHIPFCRRKCRYCDFVSYAERESLIPGYIQALSHETEWYLNHAILAEYRPVTLYIGGGTPSLAIGELLPYISRYPELFAASTLCERTIEVNPGTVSFEQLQRLRTLGFQRLSIGVQSFDDSELQQLGRIHSAQEALACFQNARETGFQNISLDLMFGLPGSTLQHWRAMLERAISLKPEHISVYNLTIEEQTPFWRDQREGRLSMPDEETQLDMYCLAQRLLRRAGYEQYEISNFALPGHRSEHNHIYWRNEDYLGLGAGAHSYLHGCRYWNHKELDDYCERADSCHATGNNHTQGSEHYPFTVEGQERLERSQAIGETIMMNLRLLDGIHLPTFRARFEQSLEELYADTLHKLCRLDLLEMSGAYLRLTSKGVVLSNEVFQEFL